MTKHTKTIQYGSHSSVDVEFETNVGPDTRVTIVPNNEDGSLCWISRGDKEEFLKDFEELLRKYYI